MLKKRKIICTIGPASLNPKVLNAFKNRGVDFFRINLSHTPKEEIKEKILELKKFGVPIIIDTEGSQVRTGNTSEIFLKEGKNIKIYNKKIECDENNLFLTPTNILEKLQIGNLISVDFNSALLIVSDVSNLATKGYVLCKIILGGEVGGRKAVKIDGGISLPVFSEKDLKAIELAKEYNINLFTLSFINCKEDLFQFKELYPEATFFSKIETKKSIENLHEILDLSEGILIDRGDLSKEVPIEKIPFIQKYIIHEARKKGKEVFVATNTLEKMASSLKPDRSEVNDIINTFLDGATGIALTKETAVGKHPVEVVNMLLTLVNQLNYLGVDETSDKDKIISKILEKEYLDEFKSPLLLVKPHGGNLVNRIEKKNILEGEINSMKKLVVDKKTIEDTEQIAIGSFSPLEGFMDENNLMSVLDNFRLANGIIWPLPIILQANKRDISGFSKGDKIVLVLKDDNEPYAILDLEQIYIPNKETISKKLYGTSSLDHQGVRTLFERGDYFLAGKINLIKRKPSKYEIYELTPSQTRRIFSERGWSHVAGFNTSNVIHKHNEFIQLEAIKKAGCDGLFIHLDTGKKKKGDFETRVVVKSYEEMANNFYPERNVVFSTSPTSPKYAGIRETLFTAIVRKNFGCSHFIANKNKIDTENFSNSNIDNKIFNILKKKEFGIIPIKFDNVFYSDAEKKFLHELDFPLYPEDKKLPFSIMQIKDMLKQGIKPPECFMRPEISSIILDRIRNNEPVFVRESPRNTQKKAKILWFTGLSGSGKTTIATSLKNFLEKENKTVKIFDGDIIRNTLHTTLGFSVEDIKKNNKLIMELCKKEQGNYDLILVSIVSPFKESREEVRKIFKENFIEIFFNCPIEECKKRDTKGLYKKSETGEINNLIGVQVPYETPENPEIILNTLFESPGDSIKKIIDFIYSR